MKRLFLTQFSLRHAWVVLLLMLAGTVALALQFPKVHFDNDPENMLAADEPVRMFHHQVKEQYNLYDFVIVGIVNETDPDGIFNMDTLGRIDDLTKALLSLRRNDEGHPEVTYPARGERPARTVAPDLHHESAFRRLLAKAFRHDPEDLFNKDGQSAIIGREIISPSVIDNIKQAELGQLKIAYLMEEPPATREEALAIRDDALANPLYRGTVVSEDGRALCLYLPIAAKPYSYNVANLVDVLTADWPVEDHVYITGLPVAEDTFGIEMLVQMATSAPLAGLAIFLLLYFFFRRVSLIIAPMVVAIVSVICTMGLLIGLGYDVHIMSSMIAIFLMPIAVADAVHILSEFYDTYHRHHDKSKTVESVIAHLFKPMLFTSLTTMAGFASLGLTPIPPVRIFGLHVAFGVGLAWVLTMTFIPAYIRLFVSERSLERLGASPHETTPSKKARLDPLLGWLGAFSYARWKLIVTATVVVMGVAAYGITRIEVNDNPVKWFTAQHRIRVADRVLNEHFGGTYTAYLTLKAAESSTLTCAQIPAALSRKAQSELAGQPERLHRMSALLEKHRAAIEARQDDDVSACFASLREAAAALDGESGDAWSRLADAIIYLEPEGLTLEGLRAALPGETDAPAAPRRALLDTLSAEPDLTGSALQDRALAFCESRLAGGLADVLTRWEADLTAPPFKQPEVLRYVEDLQAYLSNRAVVGKSSSAVDALKKAHYELNYVEPATGETEVRNRRFYSIPATASGTGQVFTQLEGMKKKDSLFHLVTRDYRAANIWVQLKSGDNKDMESVVASVSAYTTAYPPPMPMDIGWAGLTYLNVVWQDKMVVGMLSALASSFVVVLIMMMVLFRSPLFGILCMIPLSVTIAFIYGLIGLVGKDYDMPVAVLSALTLGLSVDFAIHFLERAREIQRERGSWREAVRDMFKEPAMAISRNAIVISVGFTPLLVAPLVPYRTVGFFLATIMAVSWLATLFILAALATMLERYLFKPQKEGVVS